MLELTHESDRNLALFLDDLEIAPPNFVASLLGALRAVFSTVVNLPGPHFQAVVCGSLSLSQVALKGASRFESISDLVLVADLDDDAGRALVHYLSTQSRILVDADALDLLQWQTGGDQALIESVFNVCAERARPSGQVSITLELVAGVCDAIESHKANPAVLETFRQIENDSNLLSCALLILDQGRVQNSALPLAMNETPTALNYVAPSGATATGTMSNAPCGHPSCAITSLCRELRGCMQSPVTGIGPCVILAKPLRQGKTRSGPNCLRPF